MPLFAVFQLDNSRLSNAFLSSGRDQTARDYLGIFDAADAFLATRKAAFGGIEGDPSIRRPPMGEYEVYPVQGSAAFAFELTVKPLKKDGESVEVEV